MCAECKQAVCPTQCPNHTAKTVHRCDACGEDICEGDTAYKVSLLNGELWYCTDCCGLFEVEGDSDDDY